MHELIILDHQKPYGTSVLLNQQQIFFIWYLQKNKALVLFNWLKDQKENKMEENRPDKLTRYTFNLITDLCAYLSEFTDMHDYADTMYSIGNLCHSFVHTQYAWKASYKTKNRQRLLDLCKALEIKAVDKRAFYKHK